MGRSSRVDSEGRAFRRSQNQIQRYVNESPYLLEKSLADLFIEPDLKVEWFSPLKEDGYKEYWDGRALDRLGLSSLKPELGGFWPNGGPHWDALGIGRHSGGEFRLLIEAKSHIPELKTKCTAKDPRSLELITRSLAQTQALLGCEVQSTWSNTYYQYGNRLAWLLWLQSRTPTRLVNIYFTDDEHAPTSSVQWVSELLAVKQRLGIGAEIPGAYDLLLPAKAYNKSRILTQV